MDGSSREPVNHGLTWIAPIHAAQDIAVNGSIRTRRRAMKKAAFYGECKCIVHSPATLEESKLQSAIVNIFRKMRSGLLYKKRKLR
jgi:hypothetical protein